MPTPGAMLSITKPSLTSCYPNIWCCFYQCIGWYEYTCALLFPSRIYEILPQRIQQWQQSPCVAEEHGKKLLERIRREQQQARLKLQEMERRFHELEAIIVRAKQQAIKEDEEVHRWNLGERDWQSPGSSCGWLRTALTWFSREGINLGEPDYSSFFNFTVIFIQHIQIYFDLCSMGMCSQNELKICLLIFL